MKGMLSEIFLESFVLRSVCVLLVISENLGTSRTSSKVSPSLNSNETLNRRIMIHYKLLSRRDSFLAIETMPSVSFTLCVRMMSAPFITAKTSVAREPGKRS